MFGFVRVLQCVVPCIPLVLCSPPSPLPGCVPGLIVAVGSKSFADLLLILHRSVPKDLPVALHVQGWCSSTVDAYCRHHLLYFLYFSLSSQFQFQSQIPPCMHTYLPNTCHHACTSAFLGRNKERLLNEQQETERLTDQKEKEWLSEQHYQERLGNQPKKARLGELQKKRG